MCVFFCVAHFLDWIKVIFERAKCQVFVDTKVFEDRNFPIWLEYIYSCETIFVIVITYHLPWKPTFPALLGVMNP